MSIRFSRVKAMSQDRAALFFVGGVPSLQNDLNGWTAFDEFAAMHRADEIITCSVETFEYGEGEPNDATPEEVAYIYMREAARPDFIEARTKKTGETSFIIAFNK